MVWKRLVGEFLDVIEWLDNSPDTMVWRFERHGNEIKYGAKLTVREGQMAVFVNEGEIADVFGPGMYELYTRNLPILSTLQAWPHGFESPFKAEVRHHRGHDGARAQAASGEQKNVIAIENPARTADKDAAVGVAVECGPEIGLLLEHAPPQGLDMKGTAAVVDIAAIRPAGGFDDPRSKPPEQSGRQLGRGAVGAIQHN